MTKKDFQLIAKAIRYCKNKAKTVQQLGGIFLVQEELALCLQEENQRFDKTRFHLACSKE